VLKTWQPPTWQIVISPTRAIVRHFDVIPRRLRGMLLMLAATLSIVAMNVTIREVAAQIHVFEIAFFRNLFGVLIFVPVLFRAEASPFRTRKLGLMTLRAALNIVAMLAFFYALTLIPLTDVTALSFTTPLFASVLAVVFLGETLSGRRWIGLVVGLTGALIILRPGVQEIGLGAAMVLLSSGTWACALMCIKVLTRTESALTIALYAALMQVPFAFVASLFVWVWPNWTELGLLALLGALGGFAQLCLSQAFRDADTTLVLPIDFTKLIWAGIAGYLLFAEIPDIWTVVGAVVVFAAVFSMAWQERRETARAPRLPRDAGR
jgi:drug/metabolite transporter (DMT)-like permease